MVEKDAVTNASEANQSTVCSLAGVPGERRQVENAARKITDYQLLRVIGTGTFGKVYLALLDGKPVALKALKKT